jgi:hypothetical protein
VAGCGAHLSVGVGAVKVAPDALQRRGLGRLPRHDLVVCGSTAAEAAEAVMIQRCMQLHGIGL